MSCSPFPSLVPGVALAVGAHRSHGGFPWIVFSQPRQCCACTYWVTCSKLLCLPGSYWVALVCLCFLNQISPAALGGSRLGGAPAQECREQDSSLSSLPQILIHLSSGPLIALPLSPSKFSLMALVEHREPTLPPAGRRLS